MSRAHAKHQKQQKRASKLQEKARKQVSRNALKKALPVGRPQDFSHLEMFRENKHGTGYEFWRHHLLNYLASDMEEGVWTPLFPEIYPQGGKEPVFPPGVALHRRIMDRFMDDSTRTLSDRGIQCVLWTSLRAEEMFPMVWKIKVHVRSHGGDPHKPHDPTTWVVASATGALIRHACGQWDDLKAKTTWDYESMYDDMAAEAQQVMTDEFNAAAAAAGTRSTHGDSQLP